MTGDIKMAFNADITKQNFASPVFKAITYR